HVKLERTTFPPCFAGFHFGIDFNTRIASSPTPYLLSKALMSVKEPSFSTTNLNLIETFFTFEGTSGGLNLREKSLRKFSIPFIGSAVCCTKRYTLLYISWSPVSSISDVHSIFL